LTGEVAVQRVSGRFQRVRAAHRRNRSTPTRVDVGMRYLALAVALAALAGCAGGAPARGAPPPALAPGAGGLPHPAGCATPPSPPAMSVDGTPQPAKQEALDEVASRVEPYATEHFPDVYAGLELRQETGRIRVYRKPSAPFDAWLGHAFAADCVEVADAVHARRELRALADRIAADLESWDAKGLEIATVSAAEDGR